MQKTEKKFKVVFLTTFKHAFLAYPLQKWKKNLALEGIDVRISSIVPRDIGDFDTIIITNGFCVHRAAMSQPTKSSHDYAKELADSLHQMGSKVIFFDSRDGTPSSWFGLLPYVDLFIKRQALKDKNAYTEASYAHEHSAWLYSDNPKAIEPARVDQVQKIRVAWNIGLEDFGPRRKFAKIASWYGFTWQTGTTPPTHHRSITTGFRGSLGGSRHHHRQLAIDAINSLACKGCIAGGSTSRRQYLDELKNSLTTVSPFGFGEPCYRDFEAILAGSTLIKPSMDHLETFPDVYKPWSTYVPVRWDFTDFAEQLNEIMGDDDLRQNIASNAQKIFTAHLRDHDRFCAHLQKILLAAHYPESNAY